MTEPNAATFTVTASGTAPLSYQWRRNGTNIGGATNASYTLNPTATSDSGATFDVVVSNSAGSVTSQAATLTVNPQATGAFQQGGGPDHLVSIEAEHYDTHTPQGGDSWLSISDSGASGSVGMEAGPDDGTWRNTDYVANSPRLDYVVNFVTTGTHYVWVRGLGPDTNGDSVHVGLDGQGSSASDRISSLTTNWGWSRETMDGPVATITVNTVGEHPVNLWMREDGVQVDKLVLTTTMGYTPTGTGPAESPRGGGGGDTAPTITTQPQSVTVTEPTGATFTVTASGTAPLSYQWRRNGTNIGGATNASYTLTPTATSDSGATFDVVVSNSAGSVTSQAATLTVQAGVTAPSITTQPQNVTVTEPTAATFTVTASGTAPLSYQWRRNGTNTGGATNASYTLTPTATSDSGATFDVVVSNSAGSVTSQAATLTVQAGATPPSITTQPQNVTVTEPTAATFTVTASGTAPLSYQWRRNGTNIGGATNASYTLTPTATSDSGATFDVVVSNSAGSVTSQAATLTVQSSGPSPSRWRRREVGWGRSPVLPAGSTVATLRLTVRSRMPVGRK